MIHVIKNIIKLNEIKIIEPQSLKHWSNTYLLLDNSNILDWLTRLGTHVVCDFPFYSPNIRHHSTMGGD